MCFKCKCVVKTAANQTLQMGKIHVCNLNKTNKHESFTNNKPII